MCLYQRFLPPIVWTLCPLILIWKNALYAQTALVPDSAYRPYPVIFVHGLNGGAHHWGLRYWEDDEVGSNDAVRVKDRYVMENHMLKKLGPLFMPYHRQIIRYIDEERGDTTYDTLTYLAAISLDDPGGSIDPGPYVSGDTIEYWYEKITPAGDTVSQKVSVALRNKGAGFELQHFIKQVLFTYYDTTWNLNPDAKVVLVAHSMGGVVVAEALRQDPSLKQHIHRVITLASPMHGAHQLLTSYREFYIPLVIGNFPTFHLLYALFQPSPLQLFSQYFIGQGISRCIASLSCDQDPQQCAAQALTGVLLAIISPLPKDLLGHLFSFGVSSIWLSVTRDIVRGATGCEGQER